MSRVADRDRRALSLLGMARAGGNLVLGEQACLKGVERGSIELLVMARDAGKSTQKRFRYRSEGAGVALVTWGAKERLGHALGVSPKAVVGVTDRNLARAIREAIAQGSAVDSDM